MIRIVEILLGLLPVSLFLAGLLYLDSFKLVRFSTIAGTIIAGGLAAWLSFLANTWLVENLGIAWGAETRYLGPPVEETLKAAYLVYLIRSYKVGFMVDAAICGFAIGAGFALVENLYYLFTRTHAAVSLWVIRGFGTALMHGAATAIVGIVAKSLTDRGLHLLMALFPGWAAAVIMHSLFNHFFLSPSLSTLAILIVLPLLMFVIFNRSEAATRDWLGVGFDTDRELLEMITNGSLSETRIGAYLHSLQDRFRGEILADMLCLLRLYAELSIHAKGVLLMREAGFNLPPDPEVQARMKEMQYLESSIGKTGKLALRPFLHVKSRDLWQLQLLG